MKERWILFYDGACPICLRAKSKLYDILSGNIKLTVVDINGGVAQSKGYTTDLVVLETSKDVYKGQAAWSKILSQTKYSWLTHPFAQPILSIFYWIVTKNRKLIGKLI